MSDTVSVIIPTLDEAEALPRLLGDLAREDTAHEVIVADGGSADATVEIAIGSGARIVRTLRGRGQQIRAGVTAAKGDVLLFLHADTSLPQGALAALRDALTRAPDAPGGNFALTFDGETEFARWLTGFYAWLRARGIYYGDSGVFVRRDVYDRLGGVPARAIMEDFAFNRRLESAGETLCVSEPALVTSSRRFAGRARWRIVAGWLVIHALYYLGAPAGLLAWLYDLPFPHRTKCGAFDRHAAH